MGWLVPIYVSETDEQAWREFEPHLWYFVRNLVKGLAIVPPGYTSVRSLMKITQVLDKFIESCRTRDDIEAGHYAIVGSPETVRDKLDALIGELGVGNVLGLFQLGSMPGELVRDNMSRFAEQVMPKLRASLASPATAAERA
jgi:alkanesulfonate monooxygenase SsuD/methylene tetrahydromethanopterin reductase-like flavin-dependent oxidoreductase (luciferase family)